MGPLTLFMPQLNIQLGFFFAEFGEIVSLKTFFPLLNNYVASIQSILS